jgi:hypothetical protein
MQPTPTKNPTGTTPPTRVVRTKHPTPHILPVMNGTGQQSNVLVQRRRSHSNVKQSPLEKRKATNIFPARPGTKSGMSLQNSVDINLSSRFQQSTPTGPKTHTHLLFPLYKRHPNDHPVNKARDSSRTPERRSHRPKVDTGQTEGHRSIEELAGKKEDARSLLPKRNRHRRKIPHAPLPPPASCEQNIRHHTSFQ